MEDLIVNFVMIGKLLFFDFVKSILVDMVWIVMCVVVLQVFLFFFGGFFGGGNVVVQFGVDNLVSNSGLFVNGGVFVGGVQMFVIGGVFINSVVSMLIVFGMSGGCMGVMGEVGLEVVMLLIRILFGVFGVCVMGGSSLQINVEVNIVLDGLVNVFSSQFGLDQFGCDIGMFVEQKY